MKIVTWNCNGAFRRKFNQLQEFDADILVIQECEDPKQVNHKGYNEWANNYLWTGDSKNKGLAVFAKEGIQIEQLNWSNEFKGHQVKHFLPCRINNKFDLLAVWTHSTKSPNFGYIGQFWKYMQVNRSNFKNILIIGDFNSNAIWDQWDRWWNHTDVVRELEELEIASLYHQKTKEEQGKETTPTLFFQKNPEKTYHIDYIFGSTEFQTQLKKLEVGEMKNWLKISDHMPIKVEF